MKNINLENLSVQEIKELIANNEMTLCQLDNNVIEGIMNYEIDMLCIGKGDMELIDKCAELLDSANDFISDNDFENIINKSREDYVEIIAHNTQKKPITKARIILKRIALIAAVISILVISTIGVTTAFDIDLNDLLAKVSKMPVGSRIDVEGYTFYNNGIPTTYATIEEMLEKENLEIMYPSKLPADIKFISIKKFNFDTEIEIFFETNDSNISASVTINSQYDYIDPDEIYTHNGVMYVLDYNQWHYATWNHRGNKYYISANTKEDLMLIIENMKEYKK